MKRFAMIFLVPMAAAVSALAHGKSERVLGTIATITDRSITVQTTVNKTRTNATNAKTMVMRNTDHLTMKDLKAGNRVVVEVDGCADDQAWRDAGESRAGPRRAGHQRCEGPQVQGPNQWTTVRFSGCEAVARARET